MRLGKERHQAAGFDELKQLSKPGGRP